MGIWVIVGWCGNGVERRTFPRVVGETLWRSDIWARPEWCKEGKQKDLDVCRQNEMQRPWGGHQRLYIQGTESRPVWLEQRESRTYVIWDEVKRTEKSQVTWFREGRQSYTEEEVRTECGQDWSFTVRVTSVVSLESQSGAKGASPPHLFPDVPLNVWPWASDFPSLDLSLLPQNEEIILPASQTCSETRHHALATPVPLLES